MVTEAKRKAIEEEAKKMLAGFGKALANVKIPNDVAEEVGEGFREEKNGSECSEDFREGMFANAPSKEEDFIVAEKKSW